MADEEGGAPAPDLAWDTSSVVLPGIDTTTTGLVTGGTGAIGLRVSEALLGMGAKVALMSRSNDLVEGTAERLSRSFGADRVIGITGDVGSSADAARAVEAVLQAWGRLDVLVQCAAVGDHHRLGDLDEDTIDALLATNTKGVLLMCRAAAVPMRRQGRGRIVNVTSIAAHRGTSHGAAYSASKAAVLAINRSLTVELAPDGITVNSVSPAHTPTVLRSAAEPPGAPVQLATGSADRIPMRRRGHLDDYVGPILFLASDLARYVSGEDILADGGMAARRP